MRLRLRNPQWLKTAGPWLGVVLFVLLPLYAITVATVLRSQLFSFSSEGINDEQYKALWAFVAAGLGTAATLLGLLLTRSHNQRTLAFQSDIENRKLIAQTEANERNALLQEEAASRLTLDTVVRGLDLIVSSEGSYAPRAKIAGALAALVHLGHPVIAMRTLSAAWDDNAVDSGTATWLISEVFKTGSASSMVEGAELLVRHASNLPSDQTRGQFEWPDAILEDWPSSIPLDARVLIVQSAVEVLVSRKKDWWSEGAGGYGWFVVYFYNIWQTDANIHIRNTAALIVRALVETYREAKTGQGWTWQNLGWTWKTEIMYLGTIEQEISSYEGDIADTWTSVYALTSKIHDWASSEAQATSESTAGP